MHPMVWSFSRSLRGWASRFYRPTMFGLATVILGLAVYELVTTAVTPSGQELIAADVTQGYLAGAQRFVNTGSPYTAKQLAGPWVLGYHSFIHPPAALLLFVPFLFVPLPLWWILPIATTVWCVAWLRPLPWTWPLLAFCLIWPRSIGSLLAGNTDIWATAFVAAGAVWGWPVVALIIKPTFAPLAIVAVRRRSAWLAGQWHSRRLV